MRGGLRLAAGLMLAASLSRGGRAQTDGTLEIERQPLADAPRFQAARMSLGMLSAQEAAAAAAAAAAEGNGTTTGDGAVPASSGLNGNIKIGGNVYTVKCDCGKTAFQDAADHMHKQLHKAKCRQPRKVRMFEDPSARVQDASVTFKTIEKSLGPTESISYAIADKHKLSAMSAARPRDSSPEKVSLNSPGGDIGAFVMALQVYHRLTNPSGKLTETEVLVHLADWLEHSQQQGRHFGFIYESEDNFETLAAELGNMNPVDTKGLWYPTGPENDILEKFFAALGSRDGKGAGNPIFKRWIISASLSSDAGHSAMPGYGIDKDILVFSLRALFRILYNRPTADMPNKETSFPKSLRDYVMASLGENYVVQESETAKPTAVVVISGSVGCTDAGQFPMVDQKGWWTLVPEAEHHRLQQLCEFFALKNGGMAQRVRTEMCNSVNQMAKRHMQLLLADVQETLPIFFLKMH